MKKRLEQMIDAFNEVRMRQEERTTEEEQTSATPKEQLESWGRLCWGFQPEEALHSKGQAR